MLQISMTKKNANGSPNFHLIFFYLDGYDDKHIKFKWEDRKERVSIGKKVKNLPQYNLTDFKTNFSTSKYVIGMFIYISLFNL